MRHSKLNGAKLGTGCCDWPWFEQEVRPWTSSMHDAMVQVQSSVHQEV